jgi:hypothetical protein
VADTLVAVKERVTRHEGEPERSGLVGNCWMKVGAAEVALG